MQTTRMFLIRHGATELSAEDRFAGAIDVALSEIGHEQAARLGERLAGEQLAAVYTSPLSRTRSTALYVAKPHGLEPIEREGLREIHHGRWEGLRRTEVEQRFNDEYAAWELDPYTLSLIHI